MVEIILNYNNGFKWYSNNTIFIKGYFFDENNNFYENEAAISYFKGIYNKKLFLERIQSINGVFTVIIKIEKKLCISCDPTRIFPLFYTIKNDKLFISDDILILKERLNINTIDAFASEEFLASGYTLGKKTLLKNVYQLQSSEYLYFNNCKLKKQGFHFTYSTNKLNTSPYFKLREQAILAFENSFNRLIKSLNNKQVILPLSGGFDSRLIAVLLNKHNYTNVICYTYGKKNNHEIENSKKVAEKLNLKWHFIEYSDKLIENHMNSNSFKEFIHYIGKYSTMLFVQEFFAVKYLKDHELISKEAVFLPGHSGDLLGGSQFKKTIPKNLKTNNIIKYLELTKFNYQHSKSKKQFQIKEEIKSQILSFDKNYKTKVPHSVFEDFDIKEKIAKVIFNSSGVYSFFNYTSRFFFWDKELLLFFKDVPERFKIMKLLYDDVLQNDYFKEYNVHFNEELNPNINDIHFQKVKEKIKPYLPYSIRKKYLIKNDWMNLNYTSKKIEISFIKNHIKYKSKIHSFNEMNIQWYFNHCIGKIKNKL